MKKNGFYLVMAMMVVVLAGCGIDNDKNKEDVDDPSGKEKGHEYVDLGLPSETLWATCNIGAKTPDEYGYYYAWGETDLKSCYSYENYKYAMVENNRWKWTKYCSNSVHGYNGFTDNKIVLDPEDDVAHLKWGGRWRMPTIEEIAELIAKCKWRRITRNGIEGFNVEGGNGNSIFLPVTGRRQGTELLYFEDGYYWSSSKVEEDYAVSPNAFSLHTFDFVSSTTYCYSCTGMPVRAVFRK